MLSRYIDFLDLAETGSQTMSGPLVLCGAPTTDLMAATKKYVDDNGGGDPGGVSGNVQINDNGLFGGVSAFSFNKTNCQLSIQQANDSAGSLLLKYDTGDNFLEFLGWYDSDNSGFEGGLYKENKQLIVHDARDNIRIGEDAGLSTTASDSVFIGAGAGQDLFAQGSNCFAIGKDALRQAGYGSGSGVQNSIAIGVSALAKAGYYTSTQSLYFTAIGGSAGERTGYYSSAGAGMTFIGAEAGYYCGYYTEDVVSDCIGIGYRSLYEAGKWGEDTGVIGLTAIGGYSLFKYGINNTPRYVTAIGYKAGYDQGYPGNNKLYISAHSTRYGSDCLIYGDGEAQTLKLNAEVTATKGLVIGEGGDGIDYSLIFDGQSNDGSFTFMEDEDFFDFGANFGSFSSRLGLNTYAPAALIDVVGEGNSSNFVSLRIKNIDLIDILKVTDDGTVALLDNYQSTPDRNYFTNDVVIGSGAEGNVTPTMTSNTAPSPCVVTESSFYSGYPGYKVFDGSTASTSMWLTAQGQNTGWVKLDFGSSKTVDYYGIRDRNLSAARTRAPKDWTLQGSNDNSIWVTVDTVTGETGWALNEIRYFTVDSPGSYRYYKLDVTANNGDASFLNIGEVELYNNASSGYPITTYDKLIFRDSDLYISSKDDGHLDLDADTSIDLNADVELSGDIILDTSTGAKIGTAANQLLGFYGATPVDQPSTVSDAVTQDLTGTDTIDQTKLESDLASVKNTINTVIDRLQELGLVAK